MWNTAAYDLGEVAYSVVGDDVDDLVGQAGRLVAFQ